MNTKTIKLNEELIVSILKDWVFKQFNDVNLSYIFLKNEKNAMGSEEVVAEIMIYDK